MKSILPVLMLALTLGGLAHAQDDRPHDVAPVDSGVAAVESTTPVLRRFTLNIENDKLAGTDRFYTNGFKLAYQQTDVGPISHFFNDAINLIPFLQAEPLAWGVVLGQDLYTPEDTEQELLIPDDRHYGAWLYGGFTLTRGNERAGGEEPEEGFLFQDRISLQFGVIGVDALGRQVQNNWHEVIHVATSKGWRNQLHTEVGVELYTQRKWLLKVWPSEGVVPGSDFLPHIGLAIGHPFTHFSIGGTFRFGWNLGNHFGPVQRIASAGFDRPYDFEGVRFYVFARLEGRLVAWNAFIQGNAYHEDRARLSVNGVEEPVHIEVERLVADFELGAVLQIHGLEISLTNIFRTREFEEQDDSFVFGAVNASFTF